MTDAMTPEEIRDFLSRSLGETLPAPDRARCSVMYCPEYAMLMMWRGNVDGGDVWALLCKNHWDNPIGRMYEASVHGYLPNGRDGFGQPGRYLPSRDREATP